jgi:hypothetical protein
VPLQAASEASAGGAHDRFRKIPEEIIPDATPTAAGEGRGEKKSELNRLQIPPSMPESIKSVVDELHALHDAFPVLVIDRATENTIANRLKIVDRDPATLVAALREVARRGDLPHARYVGKILPTQRDQLLTLANAAADRALTDALRAESRAQRAASRRQREVEARRQESLLIDRLWPRLDVLELDEVELRSRAGAARLALLAIASAGRFCGLSGHRSNGPSPDATHLAEALEALIRPLTKASTTLERRMKVCTAWARALIVLVGRAEPSSDADGDALRIDFLAQLGWIAPDAGSS